MRAVLDREPGDVEAMTLLAAVLRRTGRKEEAVRWQRLTDLLTPAAA